VFTTEQRSLIAEALRFYARALVDPNYPLKNYFSVSRRAEEALELAKFVEPRVQFQFKVIE
jgi:hypothetical protein